MKTVAVVSVLFADQVKLV